jgi:hypothetical protein
MSWLWPRFEEEGKELFRYLTNNFEELFNEDGTIKHFTLRDAGCYDLGTEEITEKYGKDIEKELIPWIKNELDTKCLFDTIMWKPFRDTYHMNVMYLGFKKLFQFKHYYFQLAIENECNVQYYNFCEYCEKTKFTFCFTLVLYGWKEDTSEKFQPYNIDIIKSDNIMPENDWKRK